MAGRKRQRPDDQLEISQIFEEAKHRWLQPVEVRKILQNHTRIGVSEKHADTPLGGSLFLYDRNVLRSFRKDGYKWKKTKGGKAVKEGHERLKVGGVEVLHCYYAHGEENASFQRRCYWMIEKCLSHVVLVHYRDLKSNNPNMHLDTTYHASTSFPGGINVNELCDSLRRPCHIGLIKQNEPSLFWNSNNKTDPWILKNLDSSSQCMNKELGDISEPRMSSSEDHPNPMTSETEIDDSSFLQQVTIALLGSSLFQNLLFNIIDISPNWAYERSETKVIVVGRFLKTEELDSQKWSCMFGKVEVPAEVVTDGVLRCYAPIHHSAKIPFYVTCSNSIACSEVRSFEYRVDHIHDKAVKDSVESEIEVNESSVPPQHLQVCSEPSLYPDDQLFSIVDFLPSWVYENSEVKVLISGKFLNSQHAENCKWSCMFGEVEVPAEVIADGVFCCYAPKHKAGRVPFYVTCSDRFACSEIREFEFRVAETQDIDCKDYYSDFSNEALSMRFGKLLSLSSISPNFDSASVEKNSELNSRVDKNHKMLQLTSDDEFSLKRVEEQLHEQVLKEKLHAWLLQKLDAGGKGPNVLDKGGQSLLHFGAALGYDWVLEPTITAGVSVNFRDVNGWTALHWAAFFGRERTVGFLLSLGASPGALTDPTAKYPSGETPADLASQQGHKGIAGYLAESSLSKHLETLKMNLKDGSSAEISGAKAVSDSSRDGELTDVHSLRDSLIAVCNATQAAARIHQVFRVQSFRRKQLKEYDADKFGMSDEKALSCTVLKSNKAGKHDEHVDAAAVRLQNKFRSWKGRKEFMKIRQRIVKIQADIRGHQVRKSYRKIVWSVGIVEKIILRWRRKGRGLRGFKREPVSEGPGIQVSSAKDDDDDILKEGRKQVEERVQKALARVKSMARDLEARDQYCRLLNVVTEIQETKVLNSSKGTSAYMDDDLAYIEAMLLDEHTCMPMNGDIIWQ